MDFDKLVAVYEELEKTASGNQMREILSEFFKKVSAEEISTIAYLTLGRPLSSLTGDEARQLGAADFLTKAETDINNVLAKVKEHLGGA